MWAAGGEGVGVHKQNLCIPCRHSHFTFWPVRQLVDILSLPLVTGFMPFFFGGMTIVCVCLFLTVHVISNLTTYTPYVSYCILPNTNQIPFIH